ncbi:MAG TPA: DUF2914 domain-containing protein [Rhizomicrobium sp.]|jgi:hypothetical protein
MTTFTQRLDAWRTPILRYERHLSAAAMVAGFGIDNLSFGRVDHPGAHIVFAGYLAVATVSIVLAHGLQARADRKHRRALDKGFGQAAPQSAQRPTPNARISPAARIAVDDVPPPPRPSRLRVWLPAATQFALGGLWSGFLVFYSRSAVLAASWPFLLLLVGFLIGNEVFRKYHSRFVFTSLLLYFAIYSYAVFVVPVFTRTIGRLTFLASGALAVICFLIFVRILAALDRERFAESRAALLGGAFAITAAMNIFYFTGILPPLPLALSNVGIYHSVKHEGAVYIAAGEPEPWLATLGLQQPVVHVAAGQPLSLYSAVFAPIRMQTRVTHRWQKWSPADRHWHTLSTVGFNISGGRDGGYRAYSIKSNPGPGEWRVQINSDDGRLIGRLAFTVAAVSSPVATVTKTLQ